MNFYFGLDSSAQIEAVRQRMLAQHEARRARLLAEEGRRQKANRELALALAEALKLAQQAKGRPSKQ